MLPIAILQNDQTNPPGLLGTSLAGRKLPFSLIEVFRGEPMPDLAKVSGVVLLGGSMGAFEEQVYPFLVEEKALVRGAVDQGLPVMGICLGCQIVADALGGRAYRVEPQEVGLIDVHVTSAGERDAVLAGVAGVFASWHHDSFDLPSGATLLAESHLYPQALRFGSAVGVQFHPEVTAGVLEDWIDCGAPALREAGVDGAGLLRAFHTSQPGLRDRADALFGAWIAEVLQT